MRFPCEVKTLAKGITLPNSGTYTFRDIFPLGGELWDRIRIVLKASITIGSGTTPKVLGAYGFIKNILLRTSRNEVLCNAPGVALYWLNHWLNYAAPQHTEIAAATAVYPAVLDIPFSFPFLKRREDTMVLTDRYNSLEMQLSTGAIGDFLGSVGTATVSVTADVIAIRDKAGNEKDGFGEPIALPYINVLPQQAVATKDNYDFESSMDLALFGFYQYVCTSPAAPFVGTAADNLDDIDFKDNVMTYLDRATVQHFQNERVKEFGYNAYHANSPYTGIYPHIFVKDGSVKSAYPTGGKSEIKLKNNTVITGTNYTDLLVFGMRSKR